MTKDELLKLCDEIIEAPNVGRMPNYIERIVPAAIALRSLLTEGQSTAWQDISTAPKDGTSVLLHFASEPMTIVGYWAAEYVVEDVHDNLEATWRVKWDACRLDEGFGNPTHWQPLSQPPQELANERR